MSGYYDQVMPPEVEWGVTLCCVPHCVELATVKVDGWPHCLVCADDQVERWLAWELNPELVGKLPGLVDR